MSQLDNYIASKGASTVFKFQKGQPNVWKNQNSLIIVNLEIRVNDLVNIEVLIWGGKKW